MRVLVGSGSDGDGECRPAMEEIHVVVYELSMCSITARRAAGGVIPAPASACGP
jgi:hypothetical protein